MEIDLIEQVRGREDAFHAAQTASDVAALQDVLADDLVFFAHTTGRVDDKSSYIAGVAEGRYAHGPIVRISGDIRVAGDAAVSIGMLDMVARPPDARPFSMRLHQVLFWARQDGQWRLTLRQATRIPL